MSRYVGFKTGKLHEEHVMSEYYCGGCGWPVTDHDSFCPECGGAFRMSDATPEAISCDDCTLLNTMRCPIKRALVYDGIEESACVAPGGCCAWGEGREK